MKKQLRKIVIQNNEYLYKINHNYLEDGTSSILIRIYLTEQKQTPLIIKFITIDDYYIGQPLNFGVNLMNTIIGTFEKININEPKIVQKLILQGLKNGWTGYNNNINIQDGLSYLKEFGYEIDMLIHKIDNE
ncbi:MAG: hypothetical protein LBJ88_01140 [Campylobacteraceae bacterium]|jgi:hypothetical protein|nr:hypothetical protein [Campylobacteraceae bacterium]